MSNYSINFDEKSHLNNSKIMQEIIDELNQIITYSKDDIITKTLNTSITKLNYVLLESQKIIDTIKKDYSSLKNTIEELKSKKTSINNQEIKFDYGKYIGQVENGVAHGKGVFNYDSGSKYEGDWENGKKNGKGLFFYNKDIFKGDKYDGNWVNDKQEGKGLYLFNDGDMYEGK